MNQIGKCMATFNLYFADTYAIIEVVRGKPNFKRFLDCNLVTSLWNLTELYYNLLKEGDKETAYFFFMLYYKYQIAITPLSIFHGSAFKLTYRKENLSYVDCIGYARAKELGIKFLTGDIKFKDKENV